MEKQREQAAAETVAAAHSVNDRLNLMNKILTKSLVAALGCVFAVGCSQKQEAVPVQTLINGAGSTFDNPAFMMWKEAYAKHDKDVQINYQSVGSGAGIKQLTSQTVDFGASDAPMTDEAMKTAPGKILHIPVVAGAVVVTYNIPGNPKLKLDDATLAGIYLGTITKWNDPKIAALNSGVKLPSEDIIVVHRADGSGTTFIFTDYLSAVSKEWAAKVGKSTSVSWPTGPGGKGNEQVAANVKQNPGSIGYVELAYADQNHLPAAELKNAAGKFVSPSAESVSKAMATATIPDDFRFSMVNAPGDEAYPISGASWVLLYEKQADAKKGKMLVNFLKWCVTEGQKTSPQLHYAPLPESVQERAVKLLDTVK